MDEAAVLRVLQDVGAFRAGHFVFTSGLHADTYINKDAIYPHTQAVSKLCEEMATRFSKDDIDVVIGTAYGAIILSTWTAHHLTNKRGRDVYGVYADKVGDGELAIRRGYDKLIDGNRGDVTKDMIGDPPRFESLVNVHLDQWPAESCELCANNIPVNTDIGHGADFLRNKIK